MKTPGRPRKRQRPSSLILDARPPRWTGALNALVERLDTVHSRAIGARESHHKIVADIDERIAVQETAFKAAAKVAAHHSVSEENPQPEPKEIRQDSNLQSPKDVARPPSTPLTLLMEHDPPEKVLREQSIIVRAKAINQKNTELARERLPKQPEPMRNKTLHDYVLDETVWMASDFIEERKWKIQLARKVAKMVQQHHQQKRRREARAHTEELHRIRKLANSISRGVSKFWRQIGEIADYRNALTAKAQQDIERKSKLKELLQKTEAFSFELASTLRNHPSAVQNNNTHTVVKQVSFGEGALEYIDEEDAPWSLSQEDSDRERSARVQFPKIADTEDSKSSADQALSDRPQMPSDGPSDQCVNGLDDETTMAAAEADMKNDSNEVIALQNQASFSIEDLLRSQGIDPTKYLNERTFRTLPYNQQSPESDSSDIMSIDQDEVDDEETLRAAEAEEAPDAGEGQRLASEAVATIEEILRSQGIDPDVYTADQTNYLQVPPDIGPSAPSEPNRICLQRTQAVKALPSSQNGMKEGFEVPKTQSSGAHRPSPSQSIDLKQDCQNSKSTTISNGNGTLSNLERKTDKNLRGARQNGASDHPRHPPEKTQRDSFQRSQTASLVERNSDVDLHHRAVPSVRRERATPLSYPSNPLLRGTLRDYQRQGLEWLLTLWRKNLNGILADEMGLGKTIQTISLLAWLAVEQGIWGPHLIVVPTSVMVNWEVEFKKWLPGFKVLTYFGNVKERKAKRRGWTKPDMFHVCITSYTLAVQDAVILRRKKWYYLILDEAHNIKNFQSQRWQTLLTFSSRHRLLLTGTPLQNSVMELWSLMHFLMPKLFESHSWFKDTFWKPLIEAVEAEKESNRGRSETVVTLHGILRPFLLRRLKADVEKGLPPKSEHIVPCRLSKRQRQLYEDFMARSDTRETLQSGDFFGVMNVLMQLRKVCNHPDLFEGRPILSPFSAPGIFYALPVIVARAIEKTPRNAVTLRLMGLDFHSEEFLSAGRWFEDELTRISAVKVMQVKLGDASLLKNDHHVDQNQDTRTGVQRVQNRRAAFRRSTLHHQILIHALRIRQRALLAQDTRRVFSMTTCSLVHSLRMSSASGPFSGNVRPHLVRSLEEMAEVAEPMAMQFACCVTKAIAPAVELRFHGDDMNRRKERDAFLLLSQSTSAFRSLFRPFEVRSQVTIPDTRLIQWDCGKLQMLDHLLRELKARKSRALIFTQMTRMLDILETFLNLHRHHYLRLDGTTKTDDRQKVVERFNTDPRVFCMILTTRAGGVGLNLTGADTVIFYDSDYNPAIDNQAQDRAHRIGQTRPVRVYRLISEQTVEENILRRATEKRALEAQVISSAGFTTAGIQQFQESSKSYAEINEKVSNMHSTNQEGIGVVKNGLRIQNNLKQGTQSDLMVSEKAKLSAPSNLVNSSQRISVDCSYGEFAGFDAVKRHESSIETTRLSKKNLGFGDDEDLDEYQAVTSKLIAREDEREEFALKAAEKERRDLEAEFKDTSSEEHSEQIPMRDDQCKQAKDIAMLLDTLNPIQRYALRVLESFQGANYFRHVEESHSNHAYDFQSKHGRESASDVIPHPDRDSDSDSGESHKETETLLYEVDISEEGQASYLKALTDTDADINLYLPLRDGGPEELKFSSVVHGTAAAGLECAEDAAFFPHAYNRMSRTLFATRRQKEKGLENFRKRKAEMEARRQQEAMVSRASAANQSVAPSGSSGDTSQDERPKQTTNSERSKMSRAKSEILRCTGSLPAPKKGRTDSGPKSKGASGTMGSGTSPVFVQAPSMGLFRKTSKKGGRRLSLPGMKSSIANYGNSISSEPHGLNDEWTKEEDGELIAAALTFSNNMFQVAEFLSSHPLTRLGIRRHRPVRHCIDRLVVVLGKDNKNGPQVPKATNLDANIIRKHHIALQRSFTSVRNKPITSLAVTNLQTEPHASQQKFRAEISLKMIGACRPEIPPPLTAILKSFEVPQHHKSGLKTIETTPQVVKKNRFPFLRPLRDDLRIHSQYGALNQRDVLRNDQNGLKNGDSNPFAKVSSRGTRNQAGASQRGTGQNRVAGGARASSGTKLKTGDSKNRNHSTAHRAQQVGSLPPPHNSTPRKVTITGLANTTRYHTLQQVKTSQNVSTAVLKPTAEQPGAEKAGSAMRTATIRVGTTSLGKQVNNLSTAVPCRQKVTEPAASISAGRCNTTAVKQAVASGSTPANGEQRRISTVPRGAPLPTQVSDKKLSTYGRGRNIVQAYAPSAVQVGRGASVAGQRGSISANRNSIAQSTNANVGPVRALAKKNTVSASKVSNVAATSRVLIGGSGGPRVAKFSVGIARGGITKVVGRGVYQGRGTGAGRGSSASRAAINSKFVSVAKGASTVSSGANMTRGTASARGASSRRGISRGTVPSKKGEISNSVGAGEMLKAMPSPISASRAPERKEENQAGKPMKTKGVHVPKNMSNSKSIKGTAEPSDVHANKDS